MLIVIGENEKIDLTYSELANFDSSVGYLLSKLLEKFIEGYKNDQFQTVPNGFEGDVDAWIGCMENMVYGFHCVSDTEYLEEEDIFHARKGIADFAKYFENLWF